MSCGEGAIRRKEEGDFSFWGSIKQRYNYLLERTQVGMSDSQKSRTPVCIERSG